MKKFILVSAIALIGIFAATNLFAAEGGDVIYTITAIEGKVLVMIKPSTEWVEAQVGQELRAGDGIKTLADGKAHLQTKDKKGLMMGANSEIYAEELVAEPYEEAVPDAPVPVYAPNNTAEAQASKI